jgi:hypothetical protein
MDSFDAAAIAGDGSWSYRRGFEQMEFVRIVRMTHCSQCGPHDKAPASKLVLAERTEVAKRVIWLSTIVKYAA